MGKLTDSFGKYISYSEGDYYDDADSLDYSYSTDDQDEDEAPAESNSSYAPKKGFFNAFRGRSSKRETEPDYNDSYDDDSYDESPRRSSASDNVVDFSAKSRSGNAKVILAKPAIFDTENAKDIARHVNKQRLVLINLEQMSDSDVRRMIDFLSGVVFANDGKISCVSNKTFIILPHSYDFSGDVLENLKNGYYTI